MIEASLIEDVSGLEHLEPEWDALAVACRRPCSAPGLLMPWWHHLAGAGAAPRVVAVRDGGDLIGLAPFLLMQGPLGLATLRLFGTPSMPQRTGLLALPGRGPEVSRASVGRLAESTPRPRILKLDRVDADAGWPAELAAAWPARGAWLHRDFRVEAPVLRIHGTLDEWLASKSSNFRGQMRRIRRRLEKRGAAIVAARDRDAAHRAIDAFAALHRARWDGRSTLWSDAATAALKDAADRLLGERRMRIWTVEAEGGTISSQIFFAAGGEVVYWNGGWDAAWAQERPALAAIYAGVEECFELGDARLDFGEGSHDYKLRFADDDDPVAWLTMVPRGGGYPLARVATAPKRLESTARRTARALPAPAQTTLRRLRRRGTAPRRTQASAPAVRTDHESGEGVVGR